MLGNANFDRQILPFVGVEKLPVPNRLKRRQANGKQHTLLFPGAPAFGGLSLTGPLQHDSIGSMAKARYRYNIMLRPEP